jgi:hypothetical protein
MINPIDSSSNSGLSVVLMGKTDIETQIQSRIQSFTVELAELIRQAALESVSLALNAPGAAKRGGARSLRSNGLAALHFGSVSSKAGKRSSEEIEVLSGRLFDFIKANPGQRTEQIGSALGLSTRELVLPMRKLIKDGQLKRKGQKRATTYFPR